MSARTARTIRRFARAVLASVTVTAVLLAGASGPASAAAVTMALSVAYGPTGGGGMIIGSVAPNSSTVAPFPADTTPVVQFQYVGAGSTACTPTARTRTQIAVTGTATTAGVLTVDPATVKRVTSWKLVFQVPDSEYPPGDGINTTGLVLIGAQSQSKWNICVYDSDSTTASHLLATALYTLALVPTITSISPASSPAVGEETITVNGTGFTPIPAPLSASIDGAELTNIKVASNGNSFTATTGLHAPGTGLALSVTAPGGTVSSLDPDNNPGTPATLPFAYTNGITISPTTAAVDDLVTVDVTGAGFSLLSFDTSGGASPTSAQAHIFLVDGAYDPATNRGVAECVLGVVVSDTELVCDLDLSADQLNPTTSATVPGTPIVDGAYILTVVANGATNAAGLASPSIVSSGSAFVVAPY